MPSERISACLIVQNEQERIAAALASVAFCDETIVIDGGSSDRTVEIARAAGAGVIENPWPGFARQRNLALDHAGGDWILEIDADERVSEELRASIEELLAAEALGVEMAVCALRNYFLGRPLGPSAKYPAYRARMFRRGAYRHDESRMVHEGIEAHRRPLVLAGDLEHELAATLGEALLDARRYAQLESGHLARPRGRAYLSGMLLRPSAKLLYRTFLEGGWRDGWQGMLKITLDVASDVLVWTLVLIRGQSAPAADPSAGSEHFGPRRVGPVKLVAIAGGEAAAIAATQWLSQLQALGLDVALVTAAPEARQAGAPPGVETVPVQPVGRMRPTSLMRALDVERQLRTTDAVIAVGRQARLLLRLLPKTLRPQIAGLRFGIDPALAVERAQEAVGGR